MIEKVTVLWGTRKLRRRNVKIISVSVLPSVILSMKFI